MVNHGHYSLEQKINLPDRLFSSGIQEVYGINRGVYNTIDLWFYEHGINNLHVRRKMILNFLHIVQGNGPSHEKRVKLGKGRLSEELTEYCNTGVGKKHELIG